MLTLKELTIGNFMYDVYLRSLEKYIIMFVMFKFYQRISVENFDMMFATLNLEIYLQLEIMLKEYMGCGADLFCLSIISTNFNIIVDRMIGDPGHGKDMVDGINVCDKRYLMGEMCMIDTPEADDKQSRMNAHSMVGSASFNLAK